MSMIKSHKTMIRLGFLLVILITSGGCSNEENGNISTKSKIAKIKTIFDNRDLQHAPKESNFLAVYENQSKAGQEYRSSPWSINNNSSTFWIGLGENLDPQYKKTYEILTGLLQSANGQSPLINSAVIFLAQPFTELFGNESINAAIIASLRNDANTSAEITKAKQSLKDVGFEVNDNLGADAIQDTSHSFSLSYKLDPQKIKLPSAENLPIPQNLPPLKVQVATNKELLGISTNNKKLQEIFISKTTDSQEIRHPLLETDAVKTIINSQKNPESVFAFWALDMDKLLSSPVPQQQAVTQEKVAVNGNSEIITDAIENVKDDVNSAVKRSIGLKVADCPVKSIVGTMSIRPTLHDSTYITLKENENNPIKDIASDLNNKNLLGLAPEGSVIFLNLPGKLISKLSALSPSSKDGQPLLEDNQEIIKGMANDFFTNTGSIGIGVGPLKPGAMIPEAYVIIESDDPAATASKMQLIKSLITTTPAGDFLKDWQTKKIENVDVEYSNASLFGAGLYFIKTAKGLIITTGENVAVDLIKNFNTKGGKSLSTSLHSENKDFAFDLNKEINETGAINSSLVYHIDFTALSSLIQSIQGTLSVFTGGKSLVPTEMIESLRKVGKNDGFIWQQGNNIKIDRYYLLP